MPPPPTELAVDFKVWSLPATTTMSRPATSTAPASIVAVVGASPMLTDDDALPTEMPPPPEVLAVAATLNCGAGFEFDVGPGGEAPGDGGGDAGRTGQRGAGEENSPRPPWPPSAVASEMPLPGVAMIELNG